METPHQPQQRAESHRHALSRTAGCDGGGDPGSGTRGFSRVGRRRAPAGVSNGRRLSVAVRPAPPGAARPREGGRGAPRGGGRRAAGRAFRWPRTHAPPPNGSQRATHSTSHIVDGSSFETRQLVPYNSDRPIQRGSTPFLPFMCFDAKRIFRARACFFQVSSIECASAASESPSHTKSSFVSRCVWKGIFARDSGRQPPSQPPRAIPDP